MFDASRFNEKTAAELEEASDEFAARLNRLNEEQQTTVLKEVNKGLKSGNLSAITVPTSPAPAPTPALPPAPTLAPKLASSQEAFKVIMNDPKIPQEVKLFFARGFDQTRPDSIAVEKDGTPAELTATRAERDRATDRVSDLEQQLKTTKAQVATDATDIRSLQSERTALEQEVARLQSAVSGYDLKEAKKAANVVFNAIDEQQSGRMSTIINGKEEVEEAFEKFLIVIGLKSKEEN